MEKNMNEKDTNTKNMIKNAFISNILGVTIQYSSSNYVIMAEKLSRMPVTSGADLFNVAVN